MRWAVYYKHEDCAWAKVPTYDYVVADGIKEALLVIRDFFNNTRRDMAAYDFVAEPWVEGKETPDATEGIPGKNILCNGLEDSSEASHHRPKRNKPQKHAEAKGRRQPQRQTSEPVKCIKKGGLYLITHEKSA